MNNSDEPTFFPSRQVLTWSLAIYFYQLSAWAVEQTHRCLGGLGVCLALVVGITFAHGNGPQICVFPWYWGKAPLYKGTLWKLNTVAWPSRNKLKQLTQSMDAVDILLNLFKVPLNVIFLCDLDMALQSFTVISWYSLETGLVWVTTQFHALVYRFGFWGWKSRRCRSLAEAWYVGCMRGLAVFRVKVEDGQCEYQKIALSHQAPQIISLHQKGRFLVLFQYQREQAFGALGWRQARWCKGWTACWCCVEQLLRIDELWSFWPHVRVSFGSTQQFPRSAISFCEGLWRSVIWNKLSSPFGRSDQVENMTSGARQFAFKLDCINSAP